MFKVMLLFYTRYEGITICYSLTFVHVRLLLLKTDGIYLLHICDLRYYGKISTRSARATDKKHPPPRKKIEYYVLKI